MFYNTTISSLEVRVWACRGVEIDLKLYNPKRQLSRLMCMLWRRRPLISSWEDIERPREEHM